MSYWQALLGTIAVVIVGTVEVLWILGIAWLCERLFGQVGYVSGIFIGLIIACSVSIWAIINYVENP